MIKAELNPRFRCAFGNVLHIFPKTAVFLVKLSQRQIAQGGFFPIRSDLRQCILFSRARVYWKLDPIQPGSTLVHSRSIKKDTNYTLAGWIVLTVLNSRHSRSGKKMMMLTMMARSAAPVGGALTSPS